MAKTTMKELSISFTEKDKLTQFIDLLSDAPSGVDLVLQYKLGSIKIRLFGEKDDVSESISKIKLFSKMYLESIRKNEKGFYVHHLPLIQRTTKKIIALDTLSTILNYAGYETQLVEKKLISTAKMEDVLEVLNKSFDILPELEKIKGKPLRKVLLTVSFITNRSVDFIIDYSLKKGFFREYKDKILVTQDIERCISGLIQHIPRDKTEKSPNILVKAKDNEWTTIGDRLGTISFDTDNND
ncbi:MAG: DUF2067 domain-containing protein [Candidatus Heimdallarchaeum endolithica]|uniref:DUF2067 domain-containing protein n=1 Tax=Candidatus Heimdallarchaeum endolithica TaxID=2876572 RepID=A0A9Y1FM92_9ARCH|nr:MAG: DUF2067 domain-containing protein [Candidatus Heimdallarchaeum endolithica]